MITPLLLSIFLATGLTLISLLSCPTNAACRPGIDDCEDLLLHRDRYSSATTYQCHYADWTDTKYHTHARNCTFAARVACAEVATDKRRGVWQNSTAGNCWVGVYLPYNVQDPRPNPSTIGICADQVFKPMIETCIGDPGRVDSAFLNIVVPPFGDVDYSWFVDYERAAYVVTTVGLVNAGQVPGINSTGQAGPYVGEDPAGHPKKCQVRGGYCPTGPAPPGRMVGR